MGIFGVGVLLVVQYVSSRAMLLLFGVGWQFTSSWSCPAQAAQAAAECEYVSFEFANSAANRMKKNSQ